MNAIFVLVFWLKVVGTQGHIDSFNVDSIDMGGVAKSPQICATLPMGEVLKSVPGAADKVEAGLVPRVVCGVPAPDTEMYTPDNVPQPKEVPSTPGHGDWDKGSSAPL